MDNLWKDLITSIKREKFLAVTNVFVMTLTFLILGVFLSVVMISRSALHDLENQAQITVFFKDDFEETRILELRDVLLTDERIMEAAYISKEDAFKIFMEVNQNEPVLLESVSVGILPASLEIHTKKLGFLAELAEEVQKLDGVEEVKFFRDVIERFKFISSVIYISGAILVGVFFTVSYSVVLVTLRMTINSKKEELEIQKLVGASDSYVKKPLLVLGGAFGVLAAVVAGLLIFVSLVVFSFSAAFGTGLWLFLSIRIHLALFAALLFLLLVVFGGVLGYLGSLSAVKKYLNY